MSKMTPAALRKYYRAGKGFKSHTFGECGGYLQTNMAMMPSAVAEKFQEFCSKNSAPCPLIYKSLIGEVGAPFLGQDIDIRTDLSTYRIFRKNEIFDTVPDLKSAPWDDTVSFYLGCSFSFDSKLIDAGIHIEQTEDVPMYLTNIDCITVPPFSTKMLVSMRSIPKEKLNLAVNCTLNCDYAHGAPIHIGSPDEIGINDLGKSLMRDVEDLDKDHVPVFWACGVTSSYAIKSANLEECYSHSPGSMFVCDILSDDITKFISIKSYPAADVISLDEKKAKYSIASKNTIEILKKIEIQLMEDPGKRKIESLLVEDDFTRACLHLAENGNNIAIILGFPCFADQDPLEENDGVAGAIYMAKAFVTLGKKVTFIIDGYSKVLKRFLQEVVPKADVTSIGTDYNKESTFLFDAQTGDALFSHLISIERPSPGTDGFYHRASGKTITICEPTHLLFEQAKGKITTIGIGDGGNELGMGKVHQQVVSNVPNGETVASTVSCDYLITCGVSNWGGYGVAAGLYALTKCPVFDRYRRNGLGSQDKQLPMYEMLCVKEEDEKLNLSIRDYGIRDGVNGQCGLTVDNLDYYKVHARKFEALRNLVR